MALSIHTNYSALTTNTALNKSNNSLATNQQRLGTGLRINSAADDAAGLQIATRLNAQSRGMGVAMRNTGDATSMLQTAEGAFSEMTDITQRMKDLATQAANGTNGVADLKSIQSEYDELGKELLNIFKNTKYAGEGLFSSGATNDGATGKFGLAAGVTFQIGSSASETMVVNASGKLGTLATNLGLASAIFTNNGANAATVGEEIATITAGTPDTAVNNANGTITKLDTVLNSLGEVRAQFGSSINRLNHVNNNLANMKDNTEMAKGRIMDADFAIESANMS
ncbi:Lateral flagellin, partial [Stutzerimonas zhaodongensis]